MVDFPSAGKVHADFFSKIIYPLCGARNEKVLVGPEFGVDVSVVLLPGGYAMALTTDPLSLVPTLGLRESAWLSVHLMASDITTTGCPPMYALFNLNLPPKLSTEDFHRYWKHISEFCEEIGTTIIGGHTGRFEGQNATVIGGGTIITVAPRESILTSKGGKPGDAVIVTRECAIASTAIFALSFPETVENACGREILLKGQDLFSKSSSVSTALMAVRINREMNGVTAMHDVTECGVCGALVELAVASDCGIDVNKEKIPFGKVQSAICSEFGLDPFLCIGAGSLVMTTKPECSEKVIQSLHTIGVDAVEVGFLTEKDSGCMLVDGDTQSELEHPNVDPYWEAFTIAFKKGLK